MTALVHLSIWCLNNNNNPRVFHSTSQVSTKTPVLISVQYCSYKTKLFKWKLCAALWLWLYCCQLSLRCSQEARRHSSSLSGLCTALWSWGRYGGMRGSSGGCYGHHIGAAFPWGCERNLEWKKKIKAKVSVLVRVRNVEFDSKTGNILNSTTWRLELWSHLGMFFPLSFVLVLTLKLKSCFLTEVSVKHASFWFHHPETTCFEPLWG